MPRIIYKNWNPGADARLVIARSNQICADLAAQGYDLTLRQLYYQQVARGFIPNNDRSYKRLGAIVNDARLAGMLDWDYIQDRGRNLATLSHWGMPGEIIQSAAHSFALDKWEEQPSRVEVWVEKDALSGIVGRSADRFDCAWFACKGYVSQSEQWGAAQRIRRYIAAGQNVVILHLGDHDPSGIDMTRDIRDRIRNFLHQDWLNDHMPGVSRATWGEVQGHMRDGLRDPSRGPFEVRRIALNMDQIEEYNPPPNYVKATDSRSPGYVEAYGDDCWELDALDPPVLDALITDHIEGIMDRESYDATMDIEDEHRTFLESASARWSDIVEFLNEPEDEVVHLNH